jgi:hypothetical protein
MKTYGEKTYVYGKIWIWTAVLVVLMVPVATCLYYNAWPEEPQYLRASWV